MENFHDGGGCAGLGCRTHYPHTQGPVETLENKSWDDRFGKDNPPPCMNQENWDRVIRGY